MSQRAGTTTVSLQYAQYNTPSKGSEQASTDNLKVIEFNPTGLCTDTWNRETDGVGYEEKYITGIRWNPDTHYIQIKVRTRKVDSLGREFDKSADDSTWIDVIQFVPCPAGG